MNSGRGISDVLTPRVRPLAPRVDLSAAVTAEPVGGCLRVLAYFNHVAVGI